MSKKKNKPAVSSKENSKPSVPADLINLIDAAKTSLFELDSSYSFIEEQKEQTPQSEMEILYNNTEDQSLSDRTDIGLSEIEQQAESVNEDLALADDSSMSESEPQDLTDKSSLFKYRQSRIEKISLFENGKTITEKTSLFEYSSAQTEKVVLIEDDTLIDKSLGEPEEELILNTASANLFEAAIGIDEILDETNKDIVIEKLNSFDDVEVVEGLLVDSDFENSASTELQDDFSLLEAAFQSRETEPGEPAPVLEGSELDAFESAQIEELEFVTDEQLQSVVESMLFATDRPVSMATIKLVFVGTNVSNARIKAIIEALKSYYASSRSGVTLEDIGSGFQLRTKLDNMDFLRRSLKARPFKLSGPALEVLAIVAYKQPIIKSEIDEIRGVESGHLLRALMEKNLCTFGGKSDMPGKPMLYETTRKFLEIFSLRNLKELPTLSQIDELLPEGIGDEADEKPKLEDITDGLAHQIGATYSESEEELNKITGQLEDIQTSTDFFEQEKQRQKEQKDADKAQNIRDATAVGEAVSNRDANWLRRYDEQKLQAETVGEIQAQPQEEDVFKPENDVVSSNDEFDELSMALDSIEIEECLIDPEVLEANDLADIDG